MSLSIIPGNYPREVWPDILDCVENENFSAYYDQINRPIVEIKSPYFLLIDIHNFSKFCKSCGNRMERVSMLLKAFFFLISKHIHSKNGTTIKFVGDAILAVHNDKKRVIELGKEICRLYKKNFIKSFPKTNVHILITHPRKVLRGYAVGSDYVDYSYWGTGVNNLFKAAKMKGVRPGKVYYVRRNGKPVVL
jgi:class 3 adenylate cyclase